jgi:hypothetical protein
MTKIDEALDHFEIIAYFVQTATDDYNNGDIKDATMSLNAAKIAIDNCFQY